MNPFQPANQNHEDTENHDSYITSFKNLCSRYMSNMYIKR